MKKIRKKDQKIILTRSEQKRVKELKRKRYRIRLKKNKNIHKRKSSIRQDTEINLKPKTNFSLVHNTEETYNYFTKALELLKSNKSIFFDISDVDEIDTATLTYLCAFVKNKKKITKAPIGGNLPKNKKLRELFIQSNFLSHVDPKFSHLKTKDRYGELLHEIHKQVKPDIADEVAQSANLHSLELKSSQINNIYGILVECMSNTNNHAKKGETGVYDWWLIAYKDQKSKITYFCFLDMGIGIFNSLTNKYFQNTLGKLAPLFQKDNNFKTLEAIYKRQGTSSTKKSERGKGMNHIYQSVKSDKNIQNFTLISNDVKSEIGYNKLDKFTHLDINFQGTLYYWELRPNETNNSSSQ